MQISFQLIEDSAGQEWRRQECMCGEGVVVLVVLVVVVVVVVGVVWRRGRDWKGGE